MIRKSAFRSIMVIFISIILIVFFSKQTGKADETLADNISDRKSGNSGNINGRVIDDETGKALAAASVYLVDSDIQTVADSLGYFFISGLSPGFYSVRAGYLGYQTDTIQYVVVSSKRSAYVEFRLKTLPVSGVDVVVTGSRIEQSSWGDVSVVAFSSEGLQQSPGSLGDINRAITGTVSIARIDDRYINLVIRGGSPIENGFYIDNVELSNINHFPSQGSSGGFLGMLRSELVEDVVFYTGAFPYQYGNRLSSVMNISLREGDRDRWQGRFGLDLTGASLTVEGPLANKRGSWLVSVRKGFLDLLLNMLDVEAQPDYSDFESKVVYDLDSSSQLTVLAMGGIGDLLLTEGFTATTGNDFFGTVDYTTMTMGVNWAYHEHKKYRSETSLAYTFNKWKNDNLFTGTDIPVYKNDSHEQWVALRSVHSLQLNSAFALQFGSDIRFSRLNYDYFLERYMGTNGYVSRRITIDDVVKYIKSGLYMGFTLKPHPRLTINTGARLDYSDYHKNTYLSPRFSTRYKIDSKTTCYFSAGVYRQYLPFMIILQESNPQQLIDPRAIHLVAGWKRSLSRSVKLRIELYAKEYSYLPIDSTQPTASPFDELIDNYGYMSGHWGFISTGKAYTHGVEITAQSVSTRKLSGQIGMSYSRSRYKDFNGDWRNRAGDNKYTMNVETRYKPDNRWGFVARWILGGGRPYVPYNMELSKRFRQPVYDLPRTNDARVPAYHTLNIRFERNYIFNRTSMTIYAELWNIYNHRNVNNYYWYWDGRDGALGTAEQTPFMPVIGLSYQF